MKDYVYSSYECNLGSYENKAWKNSGLDRIQTHDPCDTGAEFLGSNPVQGWMFLFVSFFFSGFIFIQ